MQSQEQGAIEKMTRTSSGDADYHMSSSIETIKERTASTRTVKEECETPLLVTPLRYGIVQPKLYRGLYPRKINLPFLRRLKLKTILSLTPEPLNDDVRAFCDQEGIEMIHIKTTKASKKGMPMTYKEVTQAIEIIISQKYAPLYLHCLNGSQATSLVIACLRKLSFWRISSIFSEFMYFSEISAADHKFVEEFRTEIELPEDTVPWIWMGLSRTGVVDHHPSVKIKQTTKDKEFDAEISVAGKE
ncbi:Oca6p [Dipodascopsis uninucleata]